MPATSLASGVSAKTALAIDARITERDIDLN